MLSTGGVVSYYSNSGAGTVDDCLSALRTLGALEVEKVLREANSLFPNGEVPGDIEKRNAVMRSWPLGGYEHRVMELLDDRVMPLLDETEKRLLIYLTKRIPSQRFGETES
jgi:hypothetical protein